MEADVVFQAYVRHYVDAGPPNKLKAMDSHGVGSADRALCRKTCGNSIVCYRETRTVDNSDGIGDDPPSHAHPGNTVNGIYNQVRHVCGGGYSKMPPSKQTQVNEGGDL